MIYCTYCHLFFFKIDNQGLKFGKELMEKMGWSAGKGLGAKEQGMQEPLRVSYKNDTKGVLNLFQ